MNVTELTDEEQLALAKLLWMTTFETALKASKNEGLRSNIISIAMIETMTVIVKALLGEE